METNRWWAGVAAKYITCSQIQDTRGLAADRESINAEDCWCVISIISFLLFLNKKRDKRSEYARLQFVFILVLTLLRNDITTSIKLFPIIMFVQHMAVVSIIFICVLLFVVVFLSYYLWFGITILVLLNLDAW